MNLATSLKVTSLNIIDIGLYIGRNTNCRGLLILSSTF